MDQRQLASFNGFFFLFNTLDVETDVERRFRVWKKQRHAYVWLNKRSSFFSTVVGVVADSSYESAHWFGFKQGAWVMWLLLQVNVEFIIICIQCRHVWWIINPWHCFPFSRHFWNGSQVSSETWFQTLVFPLIPEQIFFCRSLAWTHNRIIRISCDVARSWQWILPYRCLRGNEVRR